jgi:hypothetical protein
MSARMTARVLRGVVGALAVAALAVPAATAKGPGGGGTPPEETATNNLSVPALFVGTTSNGYGLVCDGAATEPTGTPLTGYSIGDGYYYVQGVHAWQASCGYATSAAVTAAWGDNLGGDARLKVGSPIRVEVGLSTATPAGYTGWDVVKLQPELLDRYSAYGTLATNATGSWASMPLTPYPETRVWVQGATLSIVNEDTEFVVFSGTASAEINATGRVVYGYNLRVPEPGSYTITYTFPGVSIGSTDIGTIDGTSVSYTIEVGQGGGNGGGVGQGQGGGKGHNK